MANYVGGVTSVCPFYQRESRYMITCEGLFEGMNLQLNFDSEEHKQLYMSDACSSFDYVKRCPLAKLLMLKYEEKTGP